MGRTAEGYAEEQLPHPPARRDPVGGGLVRGNCKATINANYRGTRVVSGGPVETGLATSGESHGLAIAPNGWVIYIGRGDCRTDAERGALVGLPALPRILDHADQNVGLGCGSVHVWDPAQYNGTVNSGVTRAGTLAVYGDGGQGGERTNKADHKLEWGLLGITVAPDFLQTGHVYMQYFPSFNPNSSPPGLPFERRISKLSRPRISRFTIDLETKQLDLELRGADLRVRRPDLQLLPRRRRHGLRLAGNLYVTTGDTNSSQGTGGYSGNNQPPTCPTGPPTEPSSQHCGSTRLLPGRAPDRGQHQRLQRQDAAVQAARAIADGDAAADRDRHDLHDPRRRRPQRAEPVQRHRGQRQPGQAGDLRDGPAEPVAALDRPGDRRPVHGMGRARRRRPERDARPVDVRERGPDRPRGQLRLAVLHGRQAGVPRPHRRRHAAHDQRARLRAGRSGQRRHRRLVRLRQPRQRLDPQHRPDRAPAPDGHRPRRREDAPGEPLVQPRQPERRQRLPGVPARARASTARPTTGRPRGSSARTPPRTARRS